jgi:hypothetical protein
MEKISIKVLFKQILHMKEAIIILLLRSEYLNMIFVKALLTIINLPEENQTIFLRK